MEENKTTQQIDKGLAKQHGYYLQNLVDRFCHFLDRKPQPSKEEVREKFVKTEMDWKVYCVKHNLGIRASMMFNAKIAYEWETRYANPKIKHKQ